MIQEFVTNPLQKVDYNYNIRGWLKGINDTNSLSGDLFSFKINYNTVENTISNAISPLYNGSIAETKWRTSSDNVLRRYGYQYDHLNRLTNAIYQKPENAVPETNSYNESLTYDKNGNVTSLQRNGECDDPVEVIQTDDLAYTYDSNNPNQLIKVVDSTNNPKGFSDGATVSTDVDYQYDANGNMIRDKNKDINISYNHLNLPLKITFASLNYIEYLYNAVGQKVKKVVKNGAVTTTTDYLSGYQYVNNVLEFFPTAEGYVKNTVVSGVNNYNYIYNYTDHLGNIRLSYTFDNATSSLKIVEENNYYPFGLKHKNYNQDIRTYQGIESGEIRVIPAERLSYQYKYNGKEFQDELGLNMYDYGARNYDPALGRWMNVDPLAEKFPDQSPYSFVFNNPMRFVDPDGRAPFDWIKNSKGKYEWRNEVTSASNTPAGYVYIGKEDNSIVNDLFGKSNFKASDWDFGTISIDDFDNPYSAQGFAVNQMSATTTLSVSISADIKTKYDDSGAVKSKEFLGVNIGATVSGTTSVPSMNIKLRGDNMTLQGNEMKVHQTSPYGEIRQGGDVPSLTFDSYWNSSSIQNNYGKQINLNFSFKGQYFDGDSLRSLTAPTVLGALPFANSTNVNLSVPFYNAKTENYLKP